MSMAFQDENERLVAEQAVLVYRSVAEAMKAAPHGQGLACMEDALLSNGREHLRQMLERAVEGHAELQKKGFAAGRAPAADPPRFGIAPPRR